MQEEGNFFFFILYTSEAMGSSMVDIKVDEPMMGQQQTLPGAGWTNPMGQQPGSNSLIGVLLLLIN